jgi:hypothetical protein
MHTLQIISSASVLSDVAKKVVVVATQVNFCIVSF